MKSLSNTYKNGSTYIGVLAFSKVELLIKSFSAKQLTSAQYEHQISSKHLYPSHPSVGAMLDYAEHNGIGFAAYRFFGGKDLFEFISGEYNKKGGNYLHEGKVQQIIKEICQIVQWMHRKGVAHR